MKTVLACFVGAVAVAGCSVDTQPEPPVVDRRVALMYEAFPEPVDRYGLDWVLPLESGGTYSAIRIAYFTQDVTQGEVSRKVTLFCQRQNNPELTGEVVVQRDIGLSSRTVSNGVTKQSRTLQYGCVKE